jgi:hypothetical protein
MDEQDLAAGSDSVANVKYPKRAQSRIPAGRDVELGSRDSFRKILSERTPVRTGAASYLHEYSGLKSAGGKVRIQREM